MFGNLADTLKAHMRQELIAQLKRDGTCVVPGIGTFTWTQPPHEEHAGYLHFTPDPALTKALTQ